MQIIRCKCTNCGANLDITDDKDAFVCQYCGSAVVTQKAAELYANTINNNINVNAPGNVINIINTRKDPNRFEKPYKLTIYRLAKLVGGSSTFIFDIDGGLYTLNNDGKVEIETDMKKIKGSIIQKFGDGDQRLYRFSAVGNGKNIFIMVEPTFFQNISIVKSNCNATIVRT